MNNRTSVFLLIAALVLHQAFAGTFMSGTVLCFGCVRSDNSAVVAGLPAELATCTSKHRSFVQDRCCREKDDLTVRSTHGELMGEELCPQCIGYALTILPGIIPSPCTASDTIGDFRILISRTWWFRQAPCRLYHPPTYRSAIGSPTLDCLASVVIRC